MCVHIIWLQPVLTSPFSSMTKESVVEFGELRSHWLLSLVRAATLGQTVRVRDTRNPFSGAGGFCVTQT